LKVSILLKKIVASGLFKIGITEKRLLQFGASGYSLTLMYHRIHPAEKLIQTGMYVSPATFESHLAFIKKNFDTRPLNYLKRHNGLDEISRTKKPSCMLTFDDGWKDFYDYAFPLLIKYQLPAIVFLPTEFIGTEKQFWTDRFAYLLSQRQTTILGKLSHPDILTIVKYLDGLSGSFDNQLETGIKYLKKYSLTIIKKVLSELSDIWHVDLDVQGRDFLNWTEIVEMKESGLISFGSHTSNHQILTTLDD